MILDTFEEFFWKAKLAILTPSNHEGTLMVEQQKQAFGFFKPKTKTFYIIYIGKKQSLGPCP